MGIRECLDSAVAQGQINSRQARELEKYYQERFEKRRGRTDDAQAAREAAKETADWLREDAVRQRRNALLSEKARKALADRLSDYGGIIKPGSLLGRAATLKDAMLSEIVNYGYHGRRSIVGRSAGMLAMAHSQLSDVMAHFRRTGVTGRRINRIDMEDLVNALEFQQVKNPMVQAFGSKIAGIFEDARLRFNAAGGNIPKRADFALPHRHNAREIRKLGDTPDQSRTAWKAFIRPLLDPDQMIDPTTGNVVGQNGLDAALDYVWESIAGENLSRLKPSAQRRGQGALANRYQDGRFLKFRDAGAWIAYNDRFGENDPIGTIFSHLRDIYEDIAAMEAFGPNPDATIEWMKQVYAHEAGKAAVGKPGLIRDKTAVAKVKGFDYQIDSLWRMVRGRDTVYEGPATWAANIRNVATAGMLGSTSLLAAATDPFVAGASRRLAGLPVARSMNGLIKMMASQGDQVAATRRAVIWADYMHTMNEKMRYMDQIGGSQWSRYLVDRALTWNLLKPMTEARQRLEATAWHETLGRLAQKGTDWIDLSPELQAALGGFGFDGSSWARLRQSVDSEGFLHPAGVMRQTGDRELAERYAELITQMNERAVPSASMGVKSMLLGLSPRGTATGEAVDFATQFLSFGMSFTARQMEAIYIKSMIHGGGRGARVARGASYFFSMAIPLMLGAGFYMQLQALMQGKDPADMTDPKFWAMAFVKGGGGGLFADFVQSSVDTYGATLQERLAGPGVAFISDTFDVSIGNIVRLLRAPIAEEPEKEVSQIVRRSIDYVGRYTPVLPTHPATRAAWRRMFVDQLQWIADPLSDQRFKRQRSQHKGWWMPGDFTPRRAPNWSTAFGG